jgi:hypothetical protein
MAVQNSVYHFGIFKNKACKCGKHTGVGVVTKRLKYGSNVAELPLFTLIFNKKYIISNSH